MQNETLPAKFNALPDRWVEKIFSTMSAYYGSLFLDRWRGTDLAEVKQVWAEALATFSDCPECFSAALKDLTSGSQFPPTLPEFVALCRSNYSAPRPANAILTYAAGEPLNRAEASARLAEIRARFRTGRPSSAGLA